MRHFTFALCLSLVSPLFAIEIPVSQEAAGDPQLISAGPGFPGTASLSRPMDLTKRAELPSVDTSAFEAELTRLVNVERRKIGLTALKSCEFISLAAQRHSTNMAGQRTLAHDLDGKGVGDRLDNAGFLWNKCGENIACGQETPAEAFVSWMKSPGHRANLLSADYTHIGIAVATAPEGQKYWTMVLARRQ